MKQTQFLSLKMIANILHQFNKECELSKQFVELTAEHAMFEDTCKVVKLKRLISDLVNFLDTAAEYAKIAERG